MKYWFCGPLALILFLGMAGQATGQRNYNFTTLDVPGLTYTYASGINASGQIVGSYIDAGGIYGFLATPVP